jgi:translation initiation factor 5B
MSLIPTCSVIGHIDVGKTSFLDLFKHKKTNEVRGITQQLSVYLYNLNDLQTNFKCNDNFKLDGIIFIDTPGHEYFSQMRTITSSISHLVIVMIDIIKGVESTHIEILKYLRESSIDFVIILNKLDKIYEWEINEKQSLKTTFKSQKKEVLARLNDYSNKIICQLAENEINACLYYNNKDYKTFISLIPLSSKSGEGITDLLGVISKIMENKFKLFTKSLFYKDIRGFVIDSKIDDKFGKIYSIITHSEFKEYEYINVINKNNDINKYKIKHIIKNNNRIESSNIEDFIYFVMDDKSINMESGDIILVETSNRKYKDLILSNLSLNFNDSNFNEYEYNTIEHINDYDEKLKLDKYGICIISLSKMMHGALYKMFHDDLNTPISICTVDKLNKNLIIKLSNNNTVNKNETLLDKKYDYYRVIIIFEPILKEQYIDPEILEFANKNKIKIIGSNSIYRLKEKYQKYCEEISNKIKSEYIGLIDCEMEIVPNCVFLKSSPLLIGFKIKKGILNINTKIKAISPKGNIVILGTVKSIEKDKKAQTNAIKNEEVCVKIEALDKKITYKTDFDETYKFETYRTKEEEKIFKIFNKELI